MKKSKIYDRWWFWVIVSVTLCFIVAMIVGGNITNSCVEDRKMTEDLCEVTNGYIDLVNSYQEVFQTIYPEQDLETEKIEHIDCSIFFYVN